MGIIIKEKKHYYTRLPLWFFVIVLVGLSPFIIGFTGAYFTELSTGEPCHEGNCVWGALPWIGIFITLPISMLLLIVYAIIIAIDSIKLARKKE